MVFRPLLSPSFLKRTQHTDQREAPVVVFVFVNPRYFFSGLTGMEESLPSATFWASRGHRCRPFSLPVRAFIFIADSVQHSRVYAR